MKPLEEYMLFTKQGSETVRATIPAGVRSAQCAVFHVQPGGFEPPKNDSVVRNSEISYLIKQKSVSHHFIPIILLIPKKIM